MKESPKKEKRRKLLRILRYQWILRNLPFFFFLTLLAVIYIYNGHYADRIIRDIGRTGRELQELKYEYKSLKSDVMLRSKQSALAKTVAPFGLKVLSSPPAILYDSSGQQMK